MTKEKSIDKYMVPGIECPTDLSGLSALLHKNKIEHTLQEHPRAKDEARVKEFIGYFPTGGTQILVGKYSIIRGACSFGDFEIYGLGMESPERTETTKEMLNLVKKLLA